MSATTAKLALPYPSPGDALTDFPALAQSLAEALDDKVSLTKLLDSLLGAPAASVDIIGIPQDYAHLLLVVSAQSAVAGSSDDLYLRFNADAAANYYLFGSRANNTTVVPNSAFGTSAGLHLGPCPGAAFNTRWSTNTCLISNYAGAAVKKSAKSGGGFVSNAVGSSYLDEYVGFWDAAAAAINRLTLRANGGNLAPNSRVTLYGLGS